MILVLIGLIDAVTGNDGTAVDANAIVAQTTAPSTTEPPRTTTTAAAPNTSTAPVTTSLPAETVEEFVAAFAAALEQGDAEFVFERLHPVVLARYDETSCRATVEDQVLLSSNYRISGPITGPTRASVNGVTVPEMFRAPIAFTFQGEEFEAEGSFAAVEGVMHWFTQCS